MPVRPLIDGFDFAELGRTLAGTWNTADLPRLRDVLAADSGEVEYSLSGVHDDQGRPGLQLRIRGTLKLECQRCLGILEHRLEIDSMLLLARSADEIHAEPFETDAPDRVVAGKEMLVEALLEDELLLDIPYAPRHEACSIEAGGAVSGPAQGLPFSGLRGLLGTKRRSPRLKRG